MPSARAGQAASIYEGSMYVFGGKDESNEKLSDFWRLDLETLTWEMLASPGVVAPRSGHTSSIYKDKFVVFGGIEEITKELDDMIVYDFGTKLW